MSKQQSISGFPEYLPNEQLYFNQLRDSISYSFEKYGFSPMETPAVEKISTLLSKGGIDQEVYAVKRYHDQTSNLAELALRFDLTVPLARYVAQHFGDLVFPFRRYQIAPVWRGERAQAGRYRQFYQCDIDIIGDGQLSLEHDVEVLSTLAETLVTIGIYDFKIDINHKKILVGVLESLGIIDQKQVLNVLRVIDKKKKISEDEIKKELLELVNQDQLIGLLFLMNLTGSASEQLLALDEYYSKNIVLTEGIADLRVIITLSEVFGCAQYLNLDVSLARGLAYYTGLIFETQLTAYPHLGSIASGGRYDNLAENFSKKKLPGIGMSIGLSRLFAALSEDTSKLSVSTPAQILVAVQEPEHLAFYIHLAQFFRSQGLKTEIYLEHKKLIQQFKYADKKNIPYLITANNDEIKNDLWVLKDLKKHQEYRLKSEEVVSFIKAQ